MSKVKVTITFEYDLEETEYPEGWTVGQMIEFDKNNKVADYWRYYPHNVEYRLID